MGCYNSKIIDAPVAKVWDAIKDFHDVGWAPGVIESCDVIGAQKGDQLGAQRKLNGVFVETLLAVDNHAHTFKYSIDEGPGPMEQCQGYVGTVRLAELTDGDKTFVEWTSTWTHSDGGVKEMCDGIYQALLGAMADNVKR